MNGAQLLHHFTDFVLREKPVEGISNSSTALSYPQAHERGGPPAIPQFFQEMGDGAWWDRVVGAMRKVLGRLGTVDGVALVTEEVRIAIGEERFVDLAQHLVDSEPDLTVAGFVHRCLWHGVACGLWQQVGDTWRSLEL